MIIPAKELVEYYHEMARNTYTERENLLQIVFRYIFSEMMEGEKICHITIDKKAFKKKTRKFILEFLQYSLGYHSARYHNAFCIDSMENQKVLDIYWRERQEPIEASLRSLFCARKIFEMSEGMEEVIKLKQNYNKNPASISKEEEERLDTEDWMYQILDNMMTDIQDNNNTKRKAEYYTCLSNMDPYNEMPESIQKRFLEAGYRKEEGGDAS